MAVALSWYKQNNVDQWSNWDAKTVDAGTISQNDVFLIWNNRNGSSAISNAEDCTFTTLDGAGGTTGELVTKKWVEARCDTMGETGDASFVAVGGTITRPIKGGGTNSAGVISGAANTGQLTDANNYAILTLRMHPDPLATAGNVNFLLRITYTYV